MNILINCVGRQSFLVTQFKKALQKNGKVFCADSYEDAPGLKVGDEKIVAESFSSANYLNWLTSIIKDRRIDFLITLNVDDLIVLERNREVIEDYNCHLIGGEFEPVYSTYDKYLLSKMLKDNGLDTPETFLLGEMEWQETAMFPLIVKPRFGKGSRGLMIVKNWKEFEIFKRKIQKKQWDNFIVQPVIIGQEYGADIVNDFNKKFVAVHIRRKLRMFNGETNVAVTEDSETWGEWANRISVMLRNQGTVDIDFIVKEGQNYILDINYRFGGGYAFSHLAGARTPDAYVAWMLEAPVLREWFKSEPNIKGMRRADGIVEMMKED